MKNPLSPNKYLSFTTALVLTAAVVILATAFLTRPLNSFVKKVMYQTTVTQQKITLTVVAQAQHTIIHLPKATPTLGVVIKMPSSTPTPIMVPTPTPEPKSGTARVSPIDGMTSLYIPSGWFFMGTTRDSEFKPQEEMPQHEVYLNGFWIDRLPVTIAQYKQCVLNRQCDTIVTQSIYPEYNEPNFAEHPMTYVNWYNARLYCAWVGGRLLTEAQWEKAARGTDGRLYPWGNEAPNASLLNFDNIFGSTTVVGSFLKGASPYGVLDMAGNVREWVTDWYGDTYYKDSPFVNPDGPVNGIKKVLKGGAWNDPWVYARSASRLTHDPASPGNNRGFRCARY